MVNSDSGVVKCLLTCADNSFSLPVLDTNDIFPHKLSLEYSTSFIRKKLCLCREQHDACRQKSAISLPKRVLDLGEGKTMQTIKLLETNEQVIEHYVALSHCWGPPGMVLKTTQATFDARVQDIDLSALPPTFRDAALLTNELGIRYC